MPTFWVVEYFDVIEHVLTGIFACFVSFSSDALGFEQMEEALRHSVIITVSTAAHTGFQIVISQELPSLLARKL